MSQCSQGKRRAEISFTLSLFITLVSALSLSTALTSCNVADLERFALENDVPPRPSYSGGGNVIINPSQILVPESVIRGGKQEFDGVVGHFARLIVGDADEIRFIKPVAVGGRNNFLFIVDAGARAVFKYNLITERISSFGDLGIQFAGEPGNIFVAQDMSFYIVDSVGKQVFHFNDEGDLIKVLSDDKNLSRPLDVLVDEVSNEIFVADGSYSHIVVFNEFGKATRLIGRRGVGQGRFRAITDITLGRDGLYVVDRLELPVQVITRMGEFKYSFGEGQQVFPSAIAVSNNQYSFVADKSDNMIRVYQNGELLASVGGGGSSPGRFRLITGLWANGEFLYVADSHNRRVQVMRIAGAAPSNFGTGL